MYHVEGSGLVLAQSRKIQKIMRYLLCCAFSFLGCKTLELYCRCCLEGGGMFYAFVLSYFMFFELYKYTKTMVSGEAEIEMDGMSCNYMAATWEDKNKKL